MGSTGLDSAAVQSYYLGFHIDLPKGSCMVVEQAAGAVVAAVVVAAVVVAAVVGATEGCTYYCIRVPEIHMSP